MKARATHRKSPFRQRKLVLERLESRVVLDGGIRAVVSGGTLRIQGDAQNNQIVVEQLSARSFAVSAKGGTTLINGKAEAQTFSGVRKDVSISLGAGDDVLAVKGNAALMDRLLVDTGAGSDAVVIRALNALRLNINTGADDDLLVIGRGAASGVSVKNEAAIATGTGQDAARIANSVFKRSLQLDMGGNSDDVAIQNVSVAKKSTISGGAATDTVSREGTRGEFKYSGFEQTNNSVADTAGEGEGIGIAAIAVGDAAVVIEDAVPSAAVGNVLANDTDVTEADTVVAVNGFAANVGRPVPGQFGSFQINPDGTFTYILNNNNVTVNALNNGQTLTDSIPYTVSDGIETSTATLAITIQGNTDTGPLTGVNDAAVVVEDAIPNTAVGNVLGNDTGGTGAKVVTVVGGFAANVGRPVPGQFGFFQINPDGTFTYILNNNNVTVNALNNGQTLTDSIVYTVSDGSVTSTGTLAITIQGNTDTGPLVAVADAAVVIEDAIPSAAVGNVLANDTGGTGAKVVTAVTGFAANVGRPVPGQFGFFQLNPDGTFSYILNNDNVTVNALNNGQTLTDSIVFTVSDGSTTTTGTLAITIQGNTDTGPLTGINDAAVVIEDAIPNAAVGNVLANDTGGTGAKVVTVVSGFAANVGRPVPGQFGFFQINPDGTFTYILNNDNVTVNALNNGQTLTDSIVYTVSDGSVTSTGTLAITIQGNTDTGPLTGVNDAAVVIEDAIPSAAVGNVLANDTGGTGAKVVTVVSGFAANVGRPVTGQFGFFQINPDGTFTYILNNDNVTVNALNNGQTLTDSIVYTVSDGSVTSTATLAITIQGNTDTGPLTGVNDAAEVIEDAIPNTSLGNVLTNDTGGVRAKVVTAVKGFAANVGRPVAGQFGTFQINPDGTFTYILRNSKSQVNALNNGQTLVDSIVYTVSDGSATSTATLAITIQGHTG